jgi:hypothetical protein
MTSDIVGTSSIFSGILELCISSLRADTTDPRREQFFKEWFEDFRSPVEDPNKNNSFCLMLDRSSIVRSHYAFDSAISPFLEMIHRAGTQSLHRSKSEVSRKIEREDEAEPIQSVGRSDRGPH